MNLIRLRNVLSWGVPALFLFSIVACDPKDNPDDPGALPEAAVFLTIDEESIDNGNPPNNFSEVDVNDQLAAQGLRLPLQYFKDNVGKTIDLYTGEVGDEAWHALKTIPSSWIFSGPFSNGSQNFLAGEVEEDKLDKTPDVTPLRATGLKMLIGKTVIAVVYDSEISINYAPLNCNLKGENLGLVAFDVLEVTERTDGSTGSLPKVKIMIRSVDEALTVPLVLFSNAPVPQSSSEPFDKAPPVSVAAPILVTAP